MRNYSEVFNNTSTHILKTIGAAETALEKLREEHARFMALTNSILFSKLNACFDKLKLDANANHLVVRERNKEELVITVVATPMEGCKIKPVIFTHYTKSGSSATEKQRNERTKKLRDKITELTGYRCDINQFSMEIKRYKSEEFRILMDIHIPMNDEEYANWGLVKPEVIEQLEVV